jgi:hypothetical protein
MQRFLILAVAAMTIATSTAAHDLISAGNDVSVARSTLTVTPNIDWNKLSGRPGRNAETWTLDGEELNDLSFYAGIETERTLFREVDRRNRPLPRFQSTMLPSDIPVLLENSYRVARSTSIFNITRQGPLQFAGHEGIVFTYEFIGPDEIRRSGEARGSIIDGRLFLMTFEAPTIHFFNRSIDAYRALAATARIERNTNRRR